MISRNLLVLGFFFSGKDFSKRTKITNKIKLLPVLCVVDVFAVDVVVHGLMDGRNQVSWVVIIHHNAIYVGLKLLRFLLFVPKQQESSFSCV